MPRRVRVQRGGRARDARVAPRGWREYVARTHDDSAPALVGRYVQPRTGAQRIASIAVVFAFAWFGPHNGGASHGANIDGASVIAYVKHAHVCMCDVRADCAFTIDG